MKSVIENGMEWLWKNKPDIGYVGIIVGSAIWITSTLQNFGHRIEDQKVEMNTMNREMRGEINDIKAEMAIMKADINVIKADIVEIKIFMKKIDTYLATTSETYPKEK